MAELVGHALHLGLESEVFVFQSHHPILKSVDVLLRRQKILSVAVQTFLVVIQLFVQDSVPGLKLSNESRLSLLQLVETTLRAISLTRSCQSLPIEGMKERVPFRILSLSWPKAYPP